MPTQHTTSDEEDVDDDDDVAVAVPDDDDDDDDYVYEQMMMMTGSRVFNLCLFKHLPRCIDKARGEPRERKKSAPRYAIFSIQKFSPLSNLKYIFINKAYV